jgi:hypothetical protein
MVTGHSQLRRRQPPGKFYRRGAIAGYYNDLRGKVEGPHLKNEAGLPVNEMADGRKVEFATAIAQYGLGCWDLHLETNESI